MALHFLADGDAAVAAAPGDRVLLHGAEAHHAVAVRRVREGEEVTVGDGRGLWLTGVVTAPITPKEVAITVTSRSVVAAPARRIVLAQALAKGDRDELAVQAATELGVDEIVPWQAARSVSRWEAAKAAKGVARWQSIAREAAKQAHRAWVPGVADLVTTAQLAARPGTLLVLEPTASVRLSHVALDGDGPLTVVVGPEGGISPEELARLAGAGATLVRLGDTVLRTSTAGPAALSVLSARLGRW
ncbi:MAG: 16S rRNA (uracil(1498)-N(3))-methyltransferase [Microbacterium sp.]